MAAEGTEEVGAKQAAGGGENGEQLSHSTWHVRAASLASRTNGSSLPTRASVSHQNSPSSQPTSPGAAAKKTGFNMKVGWGGDGAIVKPGRWDFAMSHGRFRVC